MVVGGSRLLYIYGGKNAAGLCQSRNGIGEAQEVKMRKVAGTIGNGGLVFLLAVAGLHWSAVDCPAQAEFSEVPAPGAPVFWADAAVFRGESADEGTIEVSYKILNPNLTYVQRDDKFIANYEIDAILRHGDNPQVASASHAESYSVPSYRETRSRDGYLLNQLRLTAPSGEYKLELLLHDRLSNRSFKRSLDIIVPAFPDGGYSLSTPLFCFAATEPPVPEKFIKYGLAVLPHVTRSYGGKEESIPIYLEVYTPGDTTVELFLEAVSHQRFQNHTRIDTAKFFPEASGPTPILFNIPLQEFEPGECRLTLKLSDRSRVLADEVQSMYRVEWSLHSMIGRDWKLIVDQLVHIAAPKELKALREAKQEDRLEMFDAFWKAKDPSPETPDNEWKNEYYRRIRFADAHYTNPYRRGWRTDFGMVYIKYGEPDQVERYPFELGQKPYEIWYYYAQGRKFVFVDMKGNDDYQLQPPYDGGRH